MANYDITTANASLEFDTVNGQGNGSAQIDVNHFLNCWAGVGLDGMAQVFVVNTTTWAVTTAGAVLEFDTQNGDNHQIILMNATHFLDFYHRTTNISYVMVLVVNTTTWEISSAISNTAINGSGNGYKTIAKIDTNHCLITWQKADDSDGFAQVIVVNTTTWAVTTVGTALEFDTQAGRPAASVLVDSNHFLLFYNDVNTDSIAQVLAVNTTTWAVTTAGSLFVFDTGSSTITRGWIFLVDSTHFLGLFNSFNTGSGSYPTAQFFAVNTSTWAVTTAGAAFKFDTNLGLSINNINEVARQLDSTHFVVFYTGKDTDGYARCIAIDTSTWTITTAGTLIEFETDYAFYMSAHKVDTNHFVNFWCGSGQDGFVQVFNIALSNAFTSTLTEVIKIVPAYIKTPTKTLTQSLIVAPVYSSLKSLARTYSEVVQVVSNSLRSTGRAFVEVVKVTPVLATLYAKVVVFVEVVQIASQWLYSLSKTFVEVVKIASITMFQAAKIFAETIIASDPVATILKVAVRTLNEIVQIAETTGGFLTGRIFNEVVKVYDAIVNAGVFSKIFAEVVKVQTFFANLLPKTFTEIVKVTSGFITGATRVFVETVVVASSFVFGAISKLFNETVKVAYDYVKVWTPSRVFTETVGVLGFIFQLGTSFTLDEFIKVHGAMGGATLGKYLLESITIGLSKIKLVLNGMEVGIWKKIKRISGVWRKIGRGSD